MTSTSMKTPREIAMDLRPTHPHVTELICGLVRGNEDLVAINEELAEENRLLRHDVLIVLREWAGLKDRIAARTSPHPEGHMERDGLGNARFVPPGEISDV